jgi:hypothetical protein
MHRALLIIGLVAALILIVGLETCFLFPPNEIGRYQGSENSEIQQYSPSPIAFLWAVGRAGRRLAGFMERHNGAVTAVATIVIATFTVVLAIVTRRAARLTRIAANAARDSADALPALERAYVFIEIEQNFIEAMRTIIQQSQDNREAAKAGNSVIVHTMPRVNHQFVNHGKTPAIVKAISAELIHQAAMPEARYVGEPITGEIVIPAGQIYPAPAEIKGPPALNQYFKKTTNLASRIIDADSADDLRAGRSFLWFYGHVVYDDVFGKEHETRFCWCYDWLASTFQQYGKEKNRRT